MSKNKILIFLHIPKTGGVTFKLIAKQQYQEHEMISLKPGEKDSFDFKKIDSQNIKYIEGHLGFGFHQLHEIDATHITILRDPIDRVISNYYFIRKSKPHFLHEEIVSKNYTLKEFVESGLTLNTENCQVRYLSGKRETPFKECTESMLEIAKSNLNNHFSLFGVQEYYNEFLMLMKEVHNWKIPYYKKYNKTKQRLGVNEVDEETREVIRSYNLLDIQLYDFAKSEFEKQIEKRGEDFQKKMNKFNFQNKIYQTLSNVKNKIYPS